MTFTTLVDLAGSLVEAVGVATILVSVVVALVLPLVRRSGAGSNLFQQYRRNLGRGILLGLELLVGADIIRTVSHRPTLANVVVLGIVVLIRTLLSFTLEVELTGRWPWQDPERFTGAKGGRSSENPAPCSPPTTRAHGPP